MLKEFKAFISRGNVIDLAVGLVLGVSFTAIVNSLVNDIIMPPVSLLIGKIDFFRVLREGTTPGPYISRAAANEAGAITLNYGFFINTVLTFIIVAIVLFFIVKAVNIFRKKEAATTKSCPYCFSTINIKATRCPNCTSELIG
ncbi:MAG: Large-conductance mechanosensitive channel [Actinobacteria bacterium ADurb.Bin346]|nr:MAG: Large-conductance mechanosensitive channel [Actinobacteria bacterium ADurb.Bin346]